MEELSYGGWGTTPMKHGDVEFSQDHSFYSEQKDVFIQTYTHMCMDHFSGEKWPRVAL